MSSPRQSKRRIRQESREISHSMSRTSQCPAAQEDQDHEEESCCLCRRQAIHAEVSDLRQKFLPKEKPTRSSAADLLEELVAPFHVL